MGRSTKPQPAEPSGEESSDPAHAGGDGAGAVPPKTAAPPSTRPGLLGKLLGGIFRPTPEERRYTEIYVAHRELVYRCLAGRKDIEDGAAEELLQEVMLEGWLQFQELKSFDNVDAMLVTIMGNQIKSYLQRRTYRLRAAGDADGLDPAAEQRSPEEEAMAIEKVMDGELCLSRMDARDAKIFRLLEIEEKSEADVAELLEVPLGTVKTWRRRACEAFKAQWNRLQRVPRGKGR